MKKRFGWILAGVIVLTALAALFVAGVALARPAWARTNRGIGNMMWGNNSSWDNAGSRGFSSRGMMGTMHSGGMMGYGGGMMGY